MVSASLVLASDCQASISSGCYRRRASAPVERPTAVAIARSFLYQVLLPRGFLVGSLIILYFLYSSALGPAYYLPHLCGGEAHDSAFPYRHQYILRFSLSFTVASGPVSKCDLEVLVLLSHFQRTVFNRTTLKASPTSPIYQLNVLV